MPRKAATPTLPEPVAPDVRLVRLDTLYPDPENVRVHPEANLKAIRESLTAFGQQRPLVVMPDGMVLAGNGTLEAARHLGWQHIAVQGCTLPLDQARAYAVADNRTGELSSWNETGLATLLRNLQAQELPLPGWDEATLRRLCGTEPLVDVRPEVERAQELRQQYGVEMGQVWTCGQHRVGCGDATDEAMVGQVLDGTIPRLMVTDPPYGVHYAPEWRNEAAAKSKLGHANRRIGRIDNDDRVDWSPAWRLFPGDVAYTWSPPGDHVILTGLALQSAGYTIRNQIIWRKPHIPISRGHYAYQHEPCWYAVKPGRTAHWIGDVMASTFWEIALDANVEGGHSTQKPLECMARPIRNHDAPEVYDPFLGSGTTLVACENLHRRCYAIDIDPNYIAVSLHRWSQLTGQHPTLVES